LGGPYGGRGSGTVATVSGREVSIEVDSDFVATVKIDGPPNNYIDAALITALPTRTRGLTKIAPVGASVLCSDGDHTRTWASR
jgi:hypothetical protein